MPKLDLYSFHCGIIDCFCEMVAAGLKPLALSEPLPSKEECEAYLPFVEECAKKTPRFVLFGAGQSGD